MSERGEKVERLQALHLKWAHAYNDNTSDETRTFLEYLVDYVDVTLPPEPEWQPGQYAWLTYDSDGNRYLAERNEDNDGWMLPGLDESVPDDEVTDVRPAVVLTAEDVVSMGGTRVPSPAPGDVWAAVLDFFAERGVSVE